MPLVLRPFLKISFFFIFLFLFFLKILEILNFFMELKFLIDDFFFEKFRNLEFFQGIENFDFFFFEKCRSLEFFSRSWKLWLIDFFFLKQPKKYEPNAPSPKAFFENFLLHFFFFFEIWRFVHYQKVKKMKMKME